MKTTKTERTAEEIREVDRWQEDNYVLVLRAHGSIDCESYRLTVEVPGHPDRDVTDDVDAYGRRIDQLVKGIP